MRYLVVVQDITSYDVVVMESTCDLDESLDMEIIPIRQTTGIEDRFKPLCPCPNSPKDILVVINIRTHTP